MGQSNIRSNSIHSRIFKMFKFAFLLTLSFVGTLTLPADRNSVAECFGIDLNLILGVERNAGVTKVGFINGVACACNSDGNEGVSYEELKNCLAPLQVYLCRQVVLENPFGKAAFDLVDDNQDGLINEQE